ncbi:MAG: metallophosphoesterase, partial [bacterium]
MNYKNVFKKFSIRVLCFSIVLNLIVLFYGHSSGYANRPELEQSNYTKSAKVHTLQPEKINLSGEYGLWVQEINKQIEVHWITAKPDSGFLKVMRQDKLLYEFVTPVSQSHNVTYDKPKGDFVTLQYGSLNNIRDKHETVIYFKEKRPKSNFNKVDSIYVLGDIHGEFDNLVQLLSNAKVVDADLNWIANKKHLVALGDLFDRGQDVTKTLWFLYKLEKQADRAGGKVHILLGNHEIMTFSNDLRYLSAKENLIATMHQTQYAKMFDVHHSVLGKWLASKP